MAATKQHSLFTSSFRHDKKDFSLVLSINADWFRQRNIKDVSENPFFCEQLKLTSTQKRKTLQTFTPEEETGAIQRKLGVCHQPFIILELDAVEYVWEGDQ